MAMDAGNDTCTSGMAQELYNNLIAEIGSLPGGFDATKMKKTLYAICKTIVDHLKTNMEVSGISSSVAVTSVSGVQTGLGVSGPGSGSATQTGSVHPT